MGVGQWIVRLTERNLSPSVRNSRIWTLLSYVSHFSPRWPKPSDPKQTYPHDPATWGLATPVVELVFSYFAGFGVEYRNLLPPRMEITPYNVHEGFS
jgi:hypothetical protein